MSRRKREQGNKANKIKSIPQRQLHSQNQNAKQQEVKKKKKKTREKSISTVLIVPWTWHAYGENIWLNLRIKKMKALQMIN